MRPIFSNIPEDRAPEQLPCQDQLTRCGKDRFAAKKLIALGSEIRAKEYETSMIGKTLELLLEEKTEIDGENPIRWDTRREYVKAVVEDTDAYKVNDLVKVTAEDFIQDHVLICR